MAISERPIDKKLLASFIDYVANGVVTAAELDRFTVNHYPDPKMEKARQECVRVYQKKKNLNSIDLADKEYLFQLADNLRNSAA